MKTTPRVRRSFAALSAVAILAMGAGCSNESSKGADNSADATPNATTEETPDTSNAAPDADIPLSEEVSVKDPPAWALPVVSGWSTPLEKKPGVYQMSKDGSEALVTGFQLTDPNSSDAEQGARAYLEQFRSAMAENTEGVSYVSDPTYDTTVLESTHGSMEFVLQELTYTASGTSYHIWSAARWIDGTLFALQYGAPEDEWSEDEWTQIRAKDLGIAF